MTDPLPALKTDDLRAAFNKVDVPTTFETEGDKDIVQEAMHDAIDALYALALECEIAHTLRQAATDRRAAQRAIEQANALTKLRKP